ncbi:MAG: Zn-ribbon domain-containing OB-fold protein [Candidatus Aenigmarchaeota archaeon]|nr:Zn-ribbon domain-containing OB-fold protein [Candidatus Aenigmarchaeota archaeon]
MPHRTAVAPEWRLKEGRYNLVGSSCACGELHFPARRYCPSCKKETVPHKFLGKGEIVTYTVIRSAPAGFEEYAPYAVAIIKLQEGPMISGQLINHPEEVKIGKRVSPVFRKLTEDGAGGIIHYGIKFELEE